MAYYLMVANQPPSLKPNLGANCDHYMLIAALNPCTCGYYGSPVKAGNCSSSLVKKYQKRISGPLLDRIDIHVQVPRVDYEKLSDNRLGESSSTMRQRQRDRLKDSDINFNADMPPAEVRKHCELDATCTILVKSAMSQLQLSARTYHRVLQLARTIADLAGIERIGASHLAEALQYRPRINDI
jgi:magnesium chelatase family protein